MSTIKNNNLEEGSILSGRDTTQYNVTFNQSMIDENIVYSVINKCILQACSDKLYLETFQEIHLDKRICNYLFSNSEILTKDNFICNISTLMSESNLFAHKVLSNEDKLDIYLMLEHLIKEIKNEFDEILKFEQRTFLRKDKYHDKRYFDKLKYYDFDKLCNCKYTCDFQEVTKHLDRIIYREYINMDMIKSFYNVVLELVCNARNYTEARDITMAVSGSSIKISYIGDCFNLLEFKGKPTGNGVGHILIKKFCKRFIKDVSVYHTYEGNRNVYQFLFKDVIFCMKDVAKIPIPQGVGRVFEIEIKKICNNYYIDTTNEIGIAISTFVQLLSQIMAKTNADSIVYIGINEQYLKDDIESILNDKYFKELKKRIIILFDEQQK